MKSEGRSFSVVIIRSKAIGEGAYPQPSPGFQARGFSLTPRFSEV
jgi:hypothetical protein